MLHVILHGRAMRGNNTGVTARFGRDAPVGLPLVLCVALGRTGGAFEANVAALAAERGLRETVDFWHFF